MPLNLVLGHVFRANPKYELIRFDLLPQAEQETLRGLTDDPEFYGILIPRDRSQGEVRSACRHTAKLLQSLEKAGPIPLSVFPLDKEDLKESVAAMVLDGLLEVAHGGAFVSGPEAHALIFGKKPDEEFREPRGFLPRLSRAALEYGQALRMDDAARLAYRVYRYNHVPLTSRWTREWPSSDAVVHALGIDEPRMKAKLRGWATVERKDPLNPWFHWNSPFARAREGVRHGYKLYISPHPGSLPAVFRAVVECLDERETYAFKVGSDAANLVRADKFVIYLWDFAEVERLAARIASALRGCPVQGVPFTAALDESGLLSWGIDPLPEKGRLAWEGPESWRSWIAGRLAAALVNAQRTGSGSLQPWEFALDRLSLEKVDTETWAPAQGFGLVVA